MKTAVLFHTCLVNEFAPEVGFAVLEVLERLGYTVHVPEDQTCCGQPAFNSGFHDAAQSAARHTITVLEATTGPIIIPSGSCGDMIVHQYAALFSEDDDWRARAAAVTNRVVEFSAFVHSHRDQLPALTLRCSVTYHPSCHLLRGLGVDREPRALLDAVAGVERCPLEAEEECCGFGGLFSVKHGEISGRMLKRKVTHVRASGAQRLVSCDMGCLLHIRGGFAPDHEQPHVQHLAQLIAEAMR